MSAESQQTRVGTGIEGLDYILSGGLPLDRLYVIQGNPGSGKTTLAIQFLREGVRLGESVLLVALAETADELREVASSHGWSLDGIHLLELDSLAERLQAEAEYTVYHPSDVDLGQTTRKIRSEVERLKPSRLVLDSVSELRVLSETNARYRREILGLKQFFTGQKCTVLVLDDLTSSDGEKQLQSIAHGVLRMERQLREYGVTRRQIQIVKMRGVSFWDGMHDFNIETGGIRIYPRVTGGESTGQAPKDLVSSGVMELDALLGGGLDRASSTLVIGPSGSGKSTICTQFIQAALQRGERVSCFLFEESYETFLRRADGMNFALGPFVASGQLELEQSNPASLSPGEFACRVRASVEERKVSLVLIDSLNGYMNSMPSERFLLIQMHELLRYLGNQGVLTMMVLSQHGMIGNSMQSPVDVSFMADSILLLRFFEACGEVRQAVSAIKKRLGTHERTIRELRLGAGGVRIGNPLYEFEGVLTGVPHYRGESEPLLQKDESD